MKINIFLVVVAMTIYPSVVMASNVLGDAKGESSLYLNKSKGSVSSNFKDKNIKFSYSRQSTNKDEWYWGITVEGKSTNNKSIILDSGEVMPNTTISAPITFRDVFFDGNNDEIAYDDVIIDIKYTVSEYSMFDSSLVFDSQLYNEKTKTGSVALAYNFSYGGFLLSGLSLAYGDANNYDTLAKKNVITTTTIGTSGSSTRVTESTKEAREGSFKEYKQTKVNGDFMFYPSLFEQRIGLSFFFRYTDSDEQTKSYFTPGAGIFLLKDKEPTKIQVGLTYQKDDETDDSLLGLVAGYHY